MKAFETIMHLLEQGAVHFEFKEHEPVITSEQAAQARGEDISIGAKAMILKADDQFVMCVLSAALKIDSRKVKELLGAKNLRFATEDEVMELTGCLRGAVPPFGPIFGLRMIHDKSLLGNDHMAFNAGERTKSIKIRTEDYFKIMPPAVHHFSQ